MRGRGRVGEETQRSLVCSLVSTDLRFHCVVDSHLLIRCLCLFFFSDFDTFMKFQVFVPRINGSNVVQLNSPTSTCFVLNDERNTVRISCATFYLHVVFKTSCLFFNFNLMIKKKKTLNVSVGQQIQNSEKTAN